MKNPNTRESGGPGKTGGAHALHDSSGTVLHIDDDPNDTLLLEAAARKAGAQFRLENVQDGDAAIAYLTGAGVYADRRLYPLPSLILLDLKMPRATGFEVLQWIRAHPQLGKMPVVILSGSELQDDITQAYSTGANSYLVKPLGFDALVNLVKSINSLWLGAAIAPQAGA
jgi:CheY-like chemotaxis protein